MEKHGFLLEISDLWGEMAAESFPCSKIYENARKIDVWRGQERDDGSLLEDNGAFAKTMELDGIFIENKDLLI